MREREKSIIIKKWKTYKLAILRALGSTNPSQVLANLGTRYQFSSQNYVSQNMTVNVPLAKYVANGYIPTMFVCYRVYEFLKPIQTVFDLTFRKLPESPHVLLFQTTYIKVLSGHYYKVQEIAMQIIIISIL